MKTNKQKALTNILILLAVIALVNFISVRIFGRIDLTENSVNSLSDASKEIAENLDDLINIRVYMTEDLPAPFNNHHRILIDMFNEYKAYAGSNLTFEFINPVTEELEHEAQEQNIQPFQVQTVNDDKIEVIKIYLGMVVQYGDQKETIPFLNNLGNLEYDISSMIVKLTRDEQKKIGYATGHGEIDFEELQNVSAFLKNQYELDPYDLTKNPHIAATTDLLIIAGPSSTYSNEALMAIDDYVMRGGKLAVFMNRMKIDPTFNDKTGKPMNTGLGKLLGHYGAGINSDMVRDMQNERINVIQRQKGVDVPITMPFPYLLKITNFNPDNAIVRNLNQFIVPFVSSVDVDKAKSMGIDAEPIMFSSEMAGRETGEFSYDPMERFTRNQYTEKHIPLAAIYSGQFPSYYYGKDALATTEKSKETSIIVVGSRWFINDRLTRNQDNLVLFANIIDYLADDKGLISIRSKNVNIPELEEVSSGTRQMLKYGNMILPPLLIALIGLLRWRRRTAIKRMAEQMLNNR